MIIYKEQSKASKGKYECMKERESKKKLFYFNEQKKSDLIDTLKS